MEIKHVVSGKKFPLPQRVCDGEKGKKKKKRQIPSVPVSEAKLRDAAHRGSLAPSLSTTVIQWPVLKKAHYGALASSVTAPGVRAPTFFRLIVASLELSFPPAASHQGAPGSGTSTEYNESLPFQSPAPRFA